MATGTLVHVAAACLLSLGIVWIQGFSELGGLGLTGRKLFNWHPLLMILAYSVCMAEGVIAFRVGGKEKRSLYKEIHKYLFCSTVVLASLGFLAVLRYHQRIGAPNFQSVHSWIGLVVLTCSWVQLILSWFLYGLKTPIVSLSVRQQLMHYHKTTGKFLYAGSVTAIATGLMQKQSFIRSSTSGLAGVNVVANIIAVGAIVQLSLVLLEYERPAKTSVASKTVDVPPLSSKKDSMDTLPTAGKPSENPAKGLTQRTSPQP